jgi:putative (di)nucleoside polyphosphate hydrolase
MINEYRKAVMAVIINEKNEILIGSSPRDGGYKFPQGGVDKGEKSIQTLKRELNEELNINVIQSDILEEYKEKVKYKNPPEKHYFGQEMIVFKIKYNNTMKFEIQDDEFEELIWIKPKELEKFNTMHRKKAYIRALELCNLL